MENETVGFVRSARGPRGGGVRTGNIRRGTCHRSAFHAAVRFGEFVFHFCDSCTPLLFFFYLFIPAGWLRLMGSVG